MHPDFGEFFRVSIGYRVRLCLPHCMTLYDSRGAPLGHIIPDFVLHIPAGILKAERGIKFWCKDMSGQRAGKKK